MSPVAAQQPWANVVRATRIVHCMRPSVVVVALLVLAGCTGTPSSSAPASAPASTTAQPTAASPARPGLTLMDSGFGQFGAHVQGIAIVTAQPDVVGEFVTVQMNFLDAVGAVVGTGEKAGGFSWSGQRLVLPVALDLKGSPTVRVAKVDVALSVSSNGSPGVVGMPLTPVRASQIAASQSSAGYRADFSMQDSMSRPIRDASVAVVCYSSGTIIGGADYPTLIGVNRPSRLSVAVTTTGRPESCTAHPNYVSMP